MVKKKIKKQTPDYVLLSVCAIIVVGLIGVYDLAVGDRLLFLIALPFLALGVFGVLFYFSSKLTKK